MAFMVPLVKNHYDIYARNNPADHPGKTPPIDKSNSLFLSATSLKSGAPVKKQYRIILTGGQVVNGGGNKKSKPVLTTSDIVKGGVALGNSTNSTSGRLYYRMPSASISLPVSAAGRVKNGLPANRRSSKAVSEAGSRSTPTSPDRASTGSTPRSIPATNIRRTVKNPLNGRVYSYSVSIPEYVPEEPEKEVEESEESSEEDKENLLSLFATSAPGGTGPLEKVIVEPSVTKKKAKKPIVMKSVSLPSSPLDVTDSLKGPSLVHSTSGSSPSPSPSPTANTTSREYLELLRKFILHLKMLKIGSNSSSKLKIKKPANSIKSNEPKDNPSPAVILPSEPENQEEEPKRARKRKDTMEDSKDL